MPINVTSGIVGCFAMPWCRICHGRTSQAAVVQIDSGCSSRTNVHNLMIIFWYKKFLSFDTKLEFNLHNQYIQAWVKISSIDSFSIPLDLILENEFHNRFLHENCMWLIWIIKVHVKSLIIVWTIFSLKKQIV